MASPRSRQLHGAGTLALSAIMVAIGVVMLVSTLARGGGPLATGVLFGFLFVAAGGARIYLLFAGSR